jgi:uncharacterized membrane protein YsdA (DUF1294 family)
MSTDSVLIVALVYSLVNLAALLLFYLDKRAAVRRERRIAERTLLLAAAGGPIGAVIGMQLFHHKTRKVKFLLVYLFLVAHLVLLIYLLSPAVRDLLTSAL